MRRRASKNDKVTFKNDCTPLKNGSALPTIE